MTDWRRVGQSVVCIDDQYVGGGWHGTSLAGCVYVIGEIKWPVRWTAGKALFRFVGYRWLNTFGDEMWEPDWRYRPVEHSGISVFESILNPINNREVVEA